MGLLGCLVLALIAVAAYFFLRTSKLKLPDGVKSIFRRG